MTIIWAGDGMCSANWINQQTLLDILTVIYEVLGLLNMKHLYMVNTQIQFIQMACDLLKECMWIRLKVDWQCSLDLISKIIH